MHCQILASGSGGNATLIRAGEQGVLVDAGLAPRALRDRLDAARLPHRGLQHVLVTHGHLDHARSAGIVAKRNGATVHCAPSLMRARSLARAGRFCALRIGESTELGPADSALRFTSIPIPHDCDPTVAFRIEHAGRALGIVTDIGRFDEPVARALRGVHVLVLEFNHDVGLLERGPYPESLKRRIRGGRGHLSNEEAAEMLRAIAGPGLHTLVLAHLSAANNTPELATAAARRALSELGLAHTRVLVASQDRVGESLGV